MLELVREKNPTAPIVWIHGMMTNGVSAMIEEIVAEFGGAEAGYYACRLTQNNAGGGSHPNLAGQKTFANELVAFIEANGLTEVTPDSDAISGGETSRTDEVDTGRGLAFKFTINADGVATKNGNEVVLDDATIGEGYTLVDFGAVITNKLAVGQGDLTIEDVDGAHTVQVPVKYLYDLEENAASYAVRIVNIPEANETSLIYARAYFVYEDADGNTHTVYADETHAANYVGKVDINDGELEW